MITASQESMHQSRNAELVPDVVSVNLVFKEFVRLIHNHEPWNIKVCSFIPCLAKIVSDSIL